MKAGDKLELIDGGEIIVKSFRETDNGLVVVDVYGDIYTEDELNLRYKLAPQFILYNVLHDNGIDEQEYDSAVYCDVFDEFMAGMEKAGYISKGSN